jgi:hypothetical protein
MRYSVSTRRLVPFACRLVVSSLLTVPAMAMAQEPTLDPEPPTAAAPAITSTLNAELPAAAAPAVPPTPIQGSTPTPPPAPRPPRPPAPNITDEQLKATARQRGERAVMERIRVQHIEGQSRFRVIRVRDGKEAQPVEVPSPAAQRVAGRENSSLMSELRWYLERFLDYPFPPETEHAEEVQQGLKDWGRAAFAALFGSGQGRESPWSTVRAMRRCPGGDPPSGVLTSAGVHLDRWVLPKSPEAGR